VDLIIRDIRTQLTDGTLNAIVPIAAVTASFTTELANYPAITLGIKDGSATVGLSGINSMTLELTVYSDVSRLQSYQIYDLVRALLNNQE